MSFLKQLAAVEDEIIKCMKCGNCQAVCPLYKETKVETAVARGKVHLAEAILKGEIEYRPELAKRFEVCLTCKACTANCPCGVEVGKIVMAARTALVRELGLPPTKRLIFKGLANQFLFKVGLSMAAKTQGLFFKRHRHGMSPYYPVSGLELRRVLPPLADKAFRIGVAEHHNVDKPQKKVAFFTGCMTNFIYPNIGHALLEVMKYNNVEVIVPKAQHCCGTPVLMHGDVNTAIEMAQSQVDIFSKLDVDAIITVCGTCGEAFIKNYPELLKDEPEYLERAQRLAEKTYDFAQFFTDILPLNKEGLGPVEAAVTYHEPCHLGRGMGVTGQPLELIKAIPGIKFNPLRQPNRCCGGAGSFSLTHYDLSYSVLKHKLAGIASSGADTLVTGCGACKMQISDGLAQEKMPVDAMHTVELLAKSYQNGKQ